MNRFKQPSTWAGLAAILQALKALLPQHAMVIDALTVVAGGVAGVVNEKGARAAPVVE